MDQRQFIKLMEPEGTTSPEAIKVLRQFTAEFPYFQTAHALLAKAMADHSDVLYDKYLKIAAAYSGDRKSLYQLLHRKSTPLFTSAPAPTTSPFILEPIAPPVIKLSEPIPEPSEPISITIPEPVEQTFLTHSPPIIEDEQVQEKQAEESTDPHEIIRKRLVEILGSPTSFEKTEERTEEKVAQPEARIESPIFHSIPTEIIDTPIVSDKFLSKEEQIIPPVSTHITEKIDQPIASVQPEVEVGKPEVLLAEERIQSATEQVIDAIDLGQIEYALESTILSALEQLPPIAKTETEEPIVDKATKAGSTTFLDWLKKTNSPGFGIVEEVHADDVPAIQTPKSETQSFVTNEKKKEKDALVDRFIATEPRIVASKAEFYSPVSQAKKSVTEHEDLVSETLAKVYYQQGHLLKARSCYEKLSLLQPEKKTYFAALVKEIDLQINHTENQDL